MKIDVLQIPIIHVEVVQEALAEVNIVRKGEKGERGLSAYEAWLDAGNIGTEEDFFSYQYNDNTNFELIFLTSLL